MALASASSLSSALLLQNSINFPPQSSRRPFDSSFPFSNEKCSITLCSAKKRIGFFDQILDYIEGGPKLRKWYGAPDLLPKDGPSTEDEDEYLEDEVRDAVLVTDGDSEMGQMVILSMVVKKTRVKALVKDKRVALEAFGSYVEVDEANSRNHFIYCIIAICLFICFIFWLLCYYLFVKSMVGDTSDRRFLKEALRGVRTIICPNEGFLSSVGSLQGVRHIILLSQFSVYRGRSGIQSLMKNNARKLAEQDESVLMNSGIPYTIIRTGPLQDTPGGKQGFSFEEGCAATGSLSKEDAACVCVEALECVPQAGFVFEVVNGENKVSDWKECLTLLMEKANQQLQ